MIDWKLKTQSCRPIGLDIGYSSIKMLQLGAHGGQVRVIAAEQTQIPADIIDDPEQRRGFIISAIERMLDEGSFNRREVVSTLANDKLKITSVRLSGTEEEKIEQVLRKEASHRFGLNAETDSINYLVAGDVRQGEEIKNELILFAADNETITSHIEMLEAAGLKPVGIDALPCALFRCFARQLQRQEDMERTAVFVDIGSRFTTVVFSRGDDISFVKQIPIGVDKFNRQIATRLGITVEQAAGLRQSLRTEKTAALALAAGSSVDCQSPVAANIDSRVGLDASTRQVLVDAVSAVAEELAREISLCFRYYTVTFRGKRVQQAIFAGGGAYETILLNILKQQLTVEVETAAPLRGFDLTDVSFDSDRRRLLCEWAVAVGLALKESV